MAGDQIDNIGTNFLREDGSKVINPGYGGNGGVLSVIELVNGEYINRIDGYAGDQVNQLTFYTNQNRKYGPYGTPMEAASFSMNNLQVGGIFGQSGIGVDALGFWTLADCQ